MNCRLILFLFAAGVALSPTAHAVSLAPTDDSFGYQFLPTFNFNSGAFASFLSTGQTGSGHDTKSVLKFDLSAVGLTSAQVTSATLEVFVGDAEQTGFGTNPSPDNPITVNLSALGLGVWNEGTATWATIPAPAGQFDSLVISSVNQTVSFDMTALVKQWLDGTLSNNGLLLEGDQPVRDSSGTVVIGAFSSKDGQFAPVLSIVPEPSAAMMALCALGALIWVSRRRDRHCGGPRQ